MGKWCPTCRAFMSDGATCHECRRRLAWGTVNRALMSWHQVAEHESQAGPADLLAVLEAVALLMQQRQALLHQHRRDMRDEQLAAQRGAGEAFDSGRNEGRREGGDR